MARFVLISAVVGQPLSGTYTKYPRGTVIVDSAAAVVIPPGNPLHAPDVIWPALCVAPSPSNMAPLDSAAQALMPGSTIITLEALATSSAGGACGENAGV